jgi:hypothetical protein
MDAVVSAVHCTHRPSSVLLRKLDMLGYLEIDRKSQRYLSCIMLCPIKRNVLEKCCVGVVEATLDRALLLVALQHPSLFESANVERRKSVLRREEKKLSAAEEARVDPSPPR